MDWGDANDSWVAVCLPNDAVKEEGGLSAGSSNEGSLEEMLAEAVEDLDGRVDTSGREVEVSSIDSENTAKNLQVKDTTRDDSKRLTEEKRSRRSQEREMKQEQHVDHEQGVSQASSEVQMKKKRSFSLRGRKSFLDVMALFDCALPVLVCTHLISLVIGFFIGYNWSSRLMAAR